MVYLVGESILQCLELLVELRGSNLGHLYNLPDEQRSMPACRRDTRTQQQRNESNHSGVPVSTISSVAVHRRHGRYPNEARDIKSGQRVTTPKCQTPLKPQPADCETQPYTVHADILLCASAEFRIATGRYTHAAYCRCESKTNVRCKSDHPMVNCHTLSMAVLSVHRWKCRRSSASQARPCSLGTTHPNNHKTPHARFGKSCYLFKSITSLDEDISRHG